MKKIQLIILLVLPVLGINAQSLNAITFISSPGTADTFKGGYTFSYITAGTPWNGALISFGGWDDRYDCQINADYRNNGISYRTKNGDLNLWNPWFELATRGTNNFIGDQSISGNVGIGTTNPQNKLDVNGTIHSKEVKVDMLGWSDFVFKKEYNLPTLEEVEKHITEKGHLENIPSEKDVLENGINLGEMNAKLLQKIEEMTLYMIEQNKQIIDLKYRLEKVEINSK